VSEAQANGQRTIVSTSGAGASSCVYDTGAARVS